MKITARVSPRRFRLSPNMLHRPINFGLFLGGCALAGTGWLLAHRLPRGPASRQLSLLGLVRHDWALVHTWIGYGGIALVTLHLMLHGSWLLRVGSNGHRWRLVAGLGAGAVVVGVLLFTPIRQSF